MNLCLLKPRLGCHNVFWYLGPSQERPSKNKTALHKAAENFSLFLASHCVHSTAYPLISGVPEQQTKFVVLLLHHLRCGQDALPSHKRDVIWHEYTGTPYFSHLPVEGVDEDGADNEELHVTGQIPGMSKTLQSKKSFADTRSWRLGNLYFLCCCWIVFRQSPKFSSPWIMFCPRGFRTNYIGADTQSW